MRIAALLLLATPLIAQDRPGGVVLSAPPIALRDAVPAIKRLYFNYDFQGADSAGVALIRRFPNDPQLRAWRIMALYRTGAERSANRAADSLLQAHPRSPWPQFAKAFVLMRFPGGDDESLRLARDLYRRVPNDRDVVWMYAYVLREAGKYKEVIAVVDSAQKRLGPNAELLVVKGDAMTILTRLEAADTTWRPRTRAVFAEARRLEPRNVNAYYLDAQFTSDTTSALLMRRAMDFSPFAHALRAGYWRSIRQRRDLTTPQKDSIIRLDVEDLLGHRQHMPNVLLAAAREYFNLKDTANAVAMQERILREHPNTPQAEDVVASRISALQAKARGKTGDTAAARLEAQRMVAEFVARPIHYSGPYLSNLTLDHFWAIRGDSTVSADSLMRFGEIFMRENTLNPHLTHEELPIKVAEKKGDYRWAERVIRMGDSLKLKRAERSRPFTIASSGVSGYADELDHAKARTLDALGYVYFLEGRLDDAERELHKARELARKYNKIYFHLGRVYEARGNLAEAQAWYSRGYPFDSRFSGTDNTKALERIHLAANGSRDGFDAFIERLKEEDRQRRRQAIADARLPGVDTLPNFSLERYGAGKARLTKADLKGKIVVMNFWGVWCSPCRMENPDLQKFHEAVKNDSTVAFVTVDYQDLPETLDEYMKKEKFTFPVIVDEKRWVAERARINSYPTTWFFDRDGKLAFKQVGASDVVLEEFLWRVEMLKGGLRP